MLKIEIVEIEGKLGIVLPEEVLNRLKLTADSEVCLIENADSLTMTVNQN
jgi:antitoxin component of MazEF toxin-antitoxin module